jgi:hypothetical protein
MPVLGSAVRVALYDEVTYKTSAGLTLGMLGYFTECGLAAQRNAVQSNTLAAGRSRAIPGAGNIDVSGSYNLEVAPQHIGFFLRHILGAPTTTGGSAPYTHVFRPTALPVGLLVEKNWVPAGITSKVEHFLGCRVADATFDFPQEGAVTLALSLQGAKYTIAAAPLDATLADPGHTGWFAPDVTLTIGGSASLIVKSANIKITNNLQTDRYTLGTAGERVDCPEGFADVTGSITAIVDTTLFSAFIDKAQARTDTALSLICTSGAGTGASAGNEKLTLTLDHALIDLTSAPINSPGGIEVSFTFNAFKSGATDKGLVATLLSPLANTLIAAS